MKKASERRRTDVRREWAERLAGALGDWPADRDSGLVLAEAACFPALTVQVALAEPGPVLVLTDTLAAAEDLAAQVRSLAALVGYERPIHLLPELETRRRHLMPENESERARLLALARRDNGVFIASIMAALAPLPPPDRFRAEDLELGLGNTEWPPGKLAEYLTRLDYDNEVEVRVPGEFSWRGGILDFYSPVHDYPVRVEYFGDEIDSLRLFDPQTQRTVNRLERCRIIPRGEAALLGAGTPFCCFFHYLDPWPASVVQCDPIKLREHLETFGEEAQQAFWRARWPHQPRRFAFTPEPLDEAPLADCREPAFQALLPQFQGMLPELEEGWETFHRQFLRTQLGRWQEDGYRFLACVGSESKQERLAELLAGDEVLSKLPLDYAQQPLASGLFFPQPRLVVLSEAELFGQPTRRPARKFESNFRTDHLLETGAELQVGDFAVHVNHGICKYLGLRQEKLRGEAREVMVLEFADEVKVYVPLDQACLVSRYVGASKLTPKLSKVGGKVWKNTKNEAGAAIADLAAELLRIQALRQSHPGESYEPDPGLAQSFADAFAYEPTPDQDRTFAEVRQDMAAARPMDRLVCGDVGFGKTEVAMRAAFAAVIAGKQVAVLVPTTVLCQQHYLSFQERFKAYPVLIEQLSRFRTRHEQGQTLSRLAHGQVDIVIGTHRLLSGDVRFKNLGLVIIDEEQRFGVLHKERLKELRANVEVLTMTATPIPRTLYLSMAGIRDISTIMTAPVARLPIHTVVAQYDEELVKEALRRELQRGGQVYYLHNRVQTIGKAADRLRQLCPEARFDVGHGQMREHELEDVMLRFLDGQTDVLVCTTIIESGLDIPNANTLIVEHADRFGLAELYQLRGRVGRYHRQAYAYMLLPKAHIPTGAARERLAAIRKFTQLGVGFRLALRDLQIRGSGNILGKEQSGYMSAIGFSLYCQLLEEAVARLRQRPYHRPLAVDVNLDFIAHGPTSERERLEAALPETFIGDQALRLETYRRLGEIRTVEKLTDFADELADRFGPRPPAVDALLAVHGLRLAGSARGLHSITVRERKVHLEGPRGLVKEGGGRLPRLRSRDVEGFLPELAQIIETMLPRPGKH